MTYYNCFSKQYESPSLIAIASATKLVEPTIFIPLTPSISLLESLTQKTANLSLGFRFESPYVLHFHQPVEGGHYFTSIN